MDVPVNGPGVIGRPVVSTVLTTVSSAFGLLRSPPLSRNTLNACAKRVSRNSRSPTACSAPAVPADRDPGDPLEEEPPEQPYSTSAMTARPAANMYGDTTDRRAFMVSPLDDGRLKTDDSRDRMPRFCRKYPKRDSGRSEEHTSEL